MMVNLCGLDALRNKFGNHDFTFKGNKKSTSKLKVK